jgi:lipopolysaccharide/colanic/teichoic acid biosynthesis glycosyltransferase
LPEDRDLLLSVRPGITDRKSIRSKGEGEILGKALDPESAYCMDVLPRKLAYYRVYVQGRNLCGDIAIIFANRKALVGRDG